MNKYSLFSLYSLWISAWNYCSVCYWEIIVLPQFLYDPFEWTCMYYHMYIIHKFDYTCKYIIYTAVLTAHNKTYSFILQYKHQFVITCIKLEYQNFLGQWVASYQETAVQDVQSEGERERERERERENYWIPRELISDLEALTNTVILWCHLYFSSHW